MAQRRLPALWLLLPQNHESEMFCIVFIRSILTALPPLPLPACCRNGSPMQLHSFVFSEFKINYFSLFSGAFEAKVIFRRNNFFFLKEAAVIAPQAPERKMKGILSLLKAKFWCLVRDQRESLKEGKWRTWQDVKHYPVWRSCCYISHLWTQKLTSQEWIEALAVVKLVAR